MKFLAALWLVAIGTAMAKEGDVPSKDGMRTQAQCHEIQRLTKLEELAKNQTELDKATSGNSTRTANLLAKASSAAQTLQTLEANATLMATCNQIFAFQDMERDCRKILNMEELARIAANQTLLDKKGKGNSTKVEAIKAKAAKQVDELKNLSSNTTLTDLCAGQKTKATCHKLEFLQKQVPKDNELSQNQTAMNSRFDGNATEVAQFQARVSQQAKTLSDLQGNNTLVTACAAVACKLFPPPVSTFADRVPTADSSNSH